jgi:hypothetical protein
VGLVRVPIEAPQDTLRQTFVVAFHVI